MDVGLHPCRQIRRTPGGREERRRLTLTPRRITPGFEVRVPLGLAQRSGPNSAEIGGSAHLLAASFNLSDCLSKCLSERGPLPLNMPRGLAGSSSEMKWTRGC